MGLFDRLFRRRERPKVDVEPDWVAREAEVLQRFAAVLSRDLGTLGQVEAALAEPGCWEVRDLGFGAATAWGWLAAGTLTARIHVVAHRERVAVRTDSLTWIVGPDARRCESVREALGDGFDVVVGRRVARRMVRDPAVIAALDAERHAELGPPPQVEVPRSLADSLAALTELSESRIVGDRVGIAATRTEGALAVAAIVAARRVDLLRVALRGPNPGGRVFAAQALLSGRAGPASEDDLRVIELLRASPVPITAGSGCSLWEATAADLLAAREVM